MNIIKYRYELRTNNNKITDIVSGEVSDVGEITIELPEKAKTAYIKIEWEIRGGD